MADTRIKDLPSVGSWTAGDRIAIDGTTTRSMTVEDIAAGVIASDAEIAAWALKSAPSGAVVGTTDAQTLTNKTLTAPAINSPTGLVKADVGLANVDNTSDANKPVSTAQGTAIALKADIASPTLTGTPSAPTASPGTNTTQLATTAFVLANAGGGAALPFKNVKTDYGAQGNGKQVTATVSISSGSPNLTATGGSFAPGDVGKRIVVPGAGTSGGILSTTIASYTSATQVALGANASTTVSGVSTLIEYGTDDTAAINSMIAACNASPNYVYWPPGIYWCTTLNTITSATFFQGASQQSVFLNTYAATGDVMTCSGPITIKDFSWTHSVTRTAGITLNLTGNGSLISNFYMFKPYLGVKSSGVFNKLENGSIGGITSRAIAANSGGVWNTGTILQLTNVSAGGSTHTNADMPEYAFRCTVGEVDMTQCYGLLANNGFLVNPGAGETVLGINIKGCWFDTTVSTGVNIAPAHSTALIQLVWISDSWLAPGSAGASGFALVINNNLNATLTKVWIANTYLISYTQGAGTGCYLDGGSSGGKIDFTMVGGQIGGQTQAFGTGVQVQGNTNGFNFNGVAITYNTTGVTLAAGCDKYLFDGCRIQNNTTAVLDSSTPTDGFFTDCVGYAQSWTPYVATVTASSGTITSASGAGRFRMQDKTVHFTVTATVTNNGTGAGALLVTLPKAASAAANGGAVVAAKNISAGGLIMGDIATTSPTLIIGTTPSNGYPGVTGQAIRFSGTYEMA